MSIPKEGIDTGGPAFGEMLRLGDYEVREGGVTMRDYFAARAEKFPPNTSIEKAAVIVGRPYPRDKGALATLTWWTEADAKYAYMQADAMLRARKVQE